MTDDIVERLRDWAAIIDESRGVGVVVMLDGSVFLEAADEIEQLRVEVEAWKQDADRSWKRGTANLNRAYELQKVVNAYATAYHHPDSYGFGDAQDALLAAATVKEDDHD